MKLETPTCAAPTRAGTLSSRAHVSECAPISPTGEKEPGTRLPGALSLLTACGDYLSTMLYFRHSRHLTFPISRFLAARSVYAALFRESTASSRCFLVGTGFALTLCMVNMAHIATA